MTSNTQTLTQKKQHSTYIAAVVFLAPALFFLAVFVLYPIINSFQISTTSWTGISPDRTFIGLDNWRELMVDPIFWGAFWNNITLVVLSLLLQIPFALLLATILDAAGKRFNLFKVIWFLPLLMSTVAVGFLFRFALNANFGIITYFAQLFGGGPVDLLGNPDRAHLAVVGVVAWRFIPFYMVLFLAGYSNLPEETYEAAIIDGASRTQYFWRIALPLLAPVVRSGAILSIIGSLAFFDLTFVMTGGGPSHASEVMATYMYRNAFLSMRMSYGSTIASAMFILITAIALISIKLLNRKENI